LSYLCFPSCWDHRCTPPCLTYWLKWVLLTFCLGVVQIMILSICSSQVAGIAGVHLCAGISPTVLSLNFKAFLSEDECPGTWEV
jgi:hypothetical protein